MEDASTRDARPLRRSRLHVQLHPRDGLFLLLAVLVVALDQLLKWVIRHSVERGDAWPGDWPVHIVHITNTGAAFGIFQNAGPLLVVTSLIGMAAILVYLFNPGFAHPAMRAGLALMFGGAVGNLIDRVYSGEVVDFIKFPHWPAFNLADSAITIGVLLLLWAMTREPGPRPTTGS
jgi:signal peptidase II